uniref:GDSL esterase/lipase At1g74460 n=1 Tax=Anthurium amnicola TaxID=1678845 RepID=A0A1D1Y5C5_9ARAE
MTALLVRGMAAVAMALLLAGSSGTRGVSCAVVQFIFGDSLSDVGNNNYLTKSLARAILPWYGIDFGDGLPNGRFTNGRTVADIVEMGCRRHDWPPTPPRLPRPICRRRRHNGKRVELRLRWWWDPQRDGVTVYSEALPVQADRAFPRDAADHPDEDRQPGGGQLLPTGSVRGRSGQQRLHQQLPDPHLPGLVVLHRGVLHHVPGVDAPSPTHAAAFLGCPDLDAIRVGADGLHPPPAVPDVHRRVPAEHEPARSHVQPGGQPAHQGPLESPSQCHLHVRGRLRRHPRCHQQSSQIRFPKLV